MAVGAWGQGGDVALAVAPIVGLLGVTLLAPRVPAYISLPIAAAAQLGTRLAYFGSPPAVIGAAATLGALDTLTPLSIIASASFLFEVLARTRWLAYLLDRLDRLTRGHPVAQLATIGWAASHVVAGAAGFGTPVALAAPLLVGLGTDPAAAVVAAAALNAHATAFGAAGTPLVYGFAPVGVDDGPGLREVGRRAAVLAAAPVFVGVPAAAVAGVVGWPPVRASWVYLALVGASFGVPLVAVAWVGYEFPTLVGGVVCLGVTVGLTHWRVGLAEWVPPPPPEGGGGGVSA